jgi:hypothetical protein
MMVGTDTIYLSHLPMFMFNPRRHPHNFQVVLEVTLHGPGNPQATYTNDRRAHPNERMYTMSPDSFEMIEFDPRDPRRNALTGADIFRGHLEREGSRQIIERANVQVERTVYFRAFDPDAVTSRKLEYLLFGKGRELFLAHIITKPPDFDQILSVTVSGHSFTDDELGRGIRVTVLDGADARHANTPRGRLKAGEKVKGEARFVDAEAGPAIPLELAAGIEFYFEEGELRLPATMDTTQEEQAAGF